MRSIEHTVLISVSKLSEILLQLPVIGILPL